MGIKKVCLYGTESTGKTTLAEQLATHFNTVYVPEVARDIIQNTDECTMDDLQEVAKQHALAIEDKIKIANRVLFVDTDLLVTRSYAKFLFETDLEVPRWVEKANVFDLYLYLKNDVPFVQDGSRVGEERRDALDAYHLRELKLSGAAYETLAGDWQTRFKKAVAFVETLLA